MVRLFAMTCGWLTGPMGLFLRGEEGRLRVPVPVYLIEHPEGRVLFDSGMHPDTAHDAAGRLGPSGAIFEVELRPAETAAARLAALGVGEGDVRYLVNSHLHFDHAGGNETIAGATVVVQRPEWEAGSDPEGVAANFYDPKDYETGHAVELVDGEHDLFGDGTVTCIPTYGHTPGHQSLRVRLPGGDVVLGADACYLRRTLEHLHLPGIVRDETAMLRSLDVLRALRHRGARIFYGHDPEFWSSVPQAPKPIEL